jgi:histidinol-phosphate/aromatic aminotransferase/cobyric acid decarboxylase-like protein
VKFAKRLDAVPPYLFAELERKVSEAERAGIDVISLGIGDPDLPTPPAIIDALAEAARDPRTHQYPTNHGTEELRTAAASFYRDRFGVELEPDGEVIPVLGGKEGVGHIALACLDPGDVCLSPDPGYPPYTSGPVFAGANVHYLPLREENDFLPDLDGAPDAQLLYLNYPNNPTGATAELDFFRHAIEIARERDLIVVHDNAYSEVAFDGYRPPSFLEADGAKDVGVEIFSLSKGWNMTGWRAGLVARQRGDRRALPAAEDESRLGHVRGRPARGRGRLDVGARVPVGDLRGLCAPARPPREGAPQGGARGQRAARDAILLGGCARGPHVGVVHRADARPGVRPRLTGRFVRSERRRVRPPLVDRSGFAARRGR